MLTRELILIITIFIIIFIILINKKNYNYKNYDINNYKNNTDNIYYRNSHSVYNDTINKNKISEYKKYRYNINNYKLKEKLLNQSEQRFYNILKSIIETNYIICPKVKISNFIGMYNKISWEDYYDKINYQTIDFLICNNSFNPIFGIIFYYGNIQILTEDEKNLNEIFKTLKFPIFKFEISENYPEDYIITKINNFIKNIEENIMNL